MAENPNMTPNLRKAGEGYKGNVESADRPDLSAQLKWEREMFNIYRALLIGMLYCIANGLTYYYFFDGWETTRTYRKAAMVVGIISVFMLPFVGGFVVYLYLQLQEKDKTE